MKVIYGTTKAEPTGDGGQGGDEQEAHHVTKKGALLLTKTRVLHPLHHQQQSKSRWAKRDCTTETYFYCGASLIVLYLKQRPGLPLYSELVVAELTEAGSWGRQPVFQTAAVDGGKSPGTLTGGQQLLVGAAVMTDTTNGVVLWHGTDEEEDKRRLQE